MPIGGGAGTPPSGNQDRETDELRRLAKAAYDGFRHAAVAPLVQLDERLWGTGALVHASAQALDVHRRYVEVGCDVRPDLVATASVPDRGQKLLELLALGGLEAVEQLVLHSVHHLGDLLEDCDPLL